jgi:thiamine biosynthesis lipoprotein
MPKSNTYTFDAIGSRWWIERRDGGVWSVQQKDKISSTAELFDSRYSRFKETSFVHTLYRTKQLAHPPSELIDLLTFAQTAYKATEGAFDCAIGSRLHELGYGTRHAAPNFNHRDFWNSILVTNAHIKLPEAVMLDFGGFGKGWLIDKLRTELIMMGIHDVIINGGGDMFVHAKTPLRVAIEHPTDPAAAVGYVDISHGALAISGTNKRTWEHKGEMFHHIIDPRSNRPTQPREDTFVVLADTAAVADMIATALIINPTLKANLETRYSANVIAINKAQ